MSHNLDSSKSRLIMLQGSFIGCMAREIGHVLLVSLPLSSYTVTKRDFSECWCKTDPWEKVKQMGLRKASLGYPNVYSIGTHTHTHKHFGFSACIERKLHTLQMCTVCLWKEANCLHLLLAKHCSKPHHFPSKKYSFCSSLLSQQMEYAVTF